MIKLCKILLILAELCVLWLFIIRFKEYKELYKKNAWKPYNIRIKYECGISNMECGSIVMIFLIFITIFL